MMLLIAVGCVDDGFYERPVADLAAYAPGDLVRFDRIGHVAATTIGAYAGSPSRHGAEVYRILYRTVGVDGGPDVASARLAVPDDAVPAIPAPMLAQLHGTTGLADRCAPSRPIGFGFSSTVDPLAATAIAAGWTVVAPDYLGLGPPGPHPYTAAGPTATSVLDGIRAAGRLYDPGHGVILAPPTSVALEGHSQGGHAVLATVTAAAAYAPELPIDRAVALAAPGAPRELLGALLDEDRWGGFIAMAMVGWSAVYPELDGDWVADPGLADALDHDCLIGLGAELDAPPSEVLAGEPLSWDGALDAEDLGDQGTAIPLLVLHGTDDDLLPIALTERYVDRIRAASDAEVTFLPIDGGDHLWLPRTARAEVASFVFGL